MTPGFGSWVVQAVRYIILLNNVIPISLYVTLELVKVLQCSLLAGATWHPHDQHQRSLIRTC